MVIHDRKKLSQIIDEHGMYDDPDITTVAIESACEEYHEHMMRWRSMDNQPEKGSWVEVLCSNLGDIHTITYGPARFNDTDLGWRPAPPLPCDVKEST